MLTSLRSSALGHTYSATTRWAYTCGSTRDPHSSTHEQIDMRYKKYRGWGAGAGAGIFFLSSWRARPNLDLCVEISAMESFKEPLHTDPCDCQASAKSSKPRKAKGVHEAREQHNTAESKVVQTHTHIFIIQYNRSYAIA